MKKLLFIGLLLLFTSIAFSHELKNPPDSRTVYLGCGFATQMDAIRHAARNVFVNTDETVTSVNLEGQTGNWCITLVITCTP